MFTEEEKFRFDLQGFIVLPGVLTRAECTVLSQLSDTAWARQPGDGALRRTEAISRWGSELLNLIDHPSVLPYLVELIRPRLRAAHGATDRGRLVGRRAILRARYLHS